MTHLYIRNIKILLLLLLSIYMASPCKGQSLSGIVPPSPTVQAIHKFDTYPVDYSTGIPDISIPLFNIQSARLNYPLKLRYHSDGYRPNDFSNVAPGWTLDGTGLISRTIKGTPDEQFERKFFGDADTLDQTIESHFDLLYDMEGLQYAEYDIFQYSFNGHSGSFILIDKDPLGSVEAVEIKKSKNKIIVNTQLLSNGSGNNSVGRQYEILGFTIIDESGTKYKFGYQNRILASSDFPWQAPSSWMLEEIITAENVSAIRFEYDSSSKYIASTSSSTTVRDFFASDIHSLVRAIDLGLSGLSNETIAAQWAEDRTPTCLTSDLHFEYLPKALKKITFSTGSILFYYDSQSYKVNKVAMYHQQGALFKEFNFIRNSAGLLKNLQETPGTNSKIEYQFSYFFETETPPQTTTDDFGYFNGFANYPNGCGKKLNITRSLSTAMSSVITAPGDLDPYTIGTANPLSDEKSTKYRVLSSIKYPTGGETRFDYELNEFTSPYSSTIVTAAGLRIKSITNYINGVDSSKKTYTYSVGKSDYPFNPLDINGNSDYPFIIGNRPIVMVSEEVNDIFRVQRVRTYGNNFSARLGNNRIRYDNVTEYNGTQSNNIGRIEHSYQLFGFGQRMGEKTSGGSAVFYVSEINDWLDALLVQEKYFAANSVVPKRRIDYGYHVYETQSYNNVNAFKYATFIGMDYPTYSQYSLIANAMPDAPPLYQYYPYDIVTGSAQMTSVRQVDFQENGDSMVNVINYTFSSADWENPVANDWYAKEVETINSDNVKSITKYQRPGDLTANPLYQQMTDSNILAPVIEEKRYKSAAGLETLLSTIQTNYKQISNLIVKDNVKTSTGSLTPEIRAQFNQYDASGNILEQQKTNDVVHSYIWGYNNTYPIAEAVNAKSNEIFFNSFEENNPGWEGSLTAYDTDFKRTGKQSGRIDKPTTGETVCLSNKWLNVSLTATKKFKFSGWVYSSGPSVELFLIMKRTGETGYYSYYDRVETNVTGKWVYLEKVADVPADVTAMAVRLDNNGGGTVWYDDIRLHPANAQMTTYTYDPLIGMTSQTDVNNRTTYYEYDGFGRLSLVKDQDGRILKKYCYNYAGQPEDCGMDMTPLWESTGLTRCKPCPSNSSYISNIQQHEEKDNNPYSTSYNTTRWVDDGVSANCVPQADWQLVSTTCQLNSSGQNTGYQIRTEKDMNPCSSSYNTTRQVNVYNTTACPLPVTCNTSNCSGNDRKCINGVCTVGRLVVVSSVWKKVLINGLYQYRWVCTKKYCFADGTLSTYSVDEYNTTGSCPVEWCALEIE